MEGTDEREAGQLLRRGMAALGLSLAEAQVDVLVRYCLELEKWNRKVNLLAKDTPLTDIVDKHFLDSLTLLPFLDRLAPEGGALLDVGSGAGFPGLAVKIARPAWQVTLLEPRERRAIFLRHILRTLQLTGVTVEPARIEEVRFAGQFQVITGRAVADVPTFLAMVRAQAGPQTQVLCMQGESGRGGVVPGDRLGGFVCIGVEETKLPISGAPRFLLLFRAGE